MNATEYVQTVTSDSGRRLYVIAEWNERTGQWHAPINDAERAAHPEHCYAFARTLRSLLSLGGIWVYRTKRAALKRAAMILGE